MAVQYIPAHFRLDNGDTYATREQAEEADAERSLETVFVAVCNEVDYEGSAVSNFLERAVKNNPDALRIVLAKFKYIPAPFTPC